MGDHRARPGPNPTAAVGVSGETEWLIDFQATPNTIHRSDCTEWTAKGAAPMPGFWRFSETQMREIVAGDSGVQLCPTCLPGSSPP